MATMLKKGVNLDVVLTERDEAHWKGRAIVVISEWMTTKISHYITV